MKHFTFNLETSFFNLLTIIGALLFSIEVWAQPTVKVPIDCEVVVTGAGTGTSLGFGGTVGDGGIITMPDPFPDPNNPTSLTFTINQNGTIANSWILKGDLSIYPNFNFAGSPITTESGTSADIMSYNKNVRNAENTSPSSKELARSIGRVIIPYEDTAAMCGNQMSFTVYKRYSDTSYIPPIIGPNCWLPDSVYTYSVDQIASDNLSDAIGLDKYYWTITDDNGDTLTTDVYEWYTSADESSITIKTPSADSLFPPLTIQCCYGRANNWDGDEQGATHNTCVTKIIGIEPPKPILYYDECINADADSIIVTNTNHVEGINYSWDVPANWIILYSTNDSIIISPDNNPGDVVLSAVTSCDSVATTAKIKRKLGIDNFIIGDTCVNANTNHTYYVSNAPVNTPLTWDLPSGWLITSSPATAQTISVDVGSQGDTIFVRATDCPQTDTFIVVNIIPDAPDSLWGQTELERCETDSLTYTISSVENAVEYGWIFPDNWSPETLITSDTSVTVVPDGATSGTVQAYVLGCENSDTISIEVNYEPLNVPDEIVIDVPCIDAGINTIVLDTVNFSIQTPTSGTNYGWDIPNNWNIISSSGGDSTSIEVETDGIAGSYNIYAWAVDDCGTSDSIYINVNIEPLNFIISAQQTANFWMFEAIPNNPGDYFWWYEDGELVLDGVNDFGYFTPASTLAMPVCLDVRDSVTGCISRYCLDELPSGFQGLKIKEEEMNLFPNPASNKIELSFNKRTKDNRQIQIYNMQGKVLFETESELQNIHIDTENLATGTYLVVAKSKKTITTKKVVITK